MPRMPHSESAFANAMAQASNNAQANLQATPTGNAHKLTPNLQPASPLVGRPAHTQGFVSVVTAEKPDPFPYRLLNVVLYGALAWEVLSIATKVYALVL
jgi:hypothetical protein